MSKKILLILVSILTGNLTAVNAKINYVPLYIVDTQPEVEAVEHAPSMPLFITQDDHKLTLPEFEDSLTFMILNGDQSVFQTDYQPTVNVPASLVGDFEVRWRLGKTHGNTYLKAYNQTNDRYFTKSSLNTQGIGVIMKKDFNGLRDLFATKKKKKRSTTTQVQEHHAK